VRARAEELTPLLAYELSERRKWRVGQAHRGRIAGLRRALSQRGLEGARPPPWLPRELRANWTEAARDFAATAGGDPDEAYRNIVMRYGVKRIDPAAPGFERDLRQFHRNYVTNFPLPEEQESRQGFRELWRQSPREGGYQEVGCSVVCPLTGRYLMGVNFTIQPRSDSVHFIYGFVNPAARGIGGFSACLIALMRQIARAEIAAWLARHNDERPPFHAADGPLILFEKNIIEQMSLTGILKDTAGIDIDHPPRRRSRLVSSAISQSIRDLIWDRRGGRVVDYSYVQSSLDGVVRVPDGNRDDVIALILRAPLDEPRRRRAAAVLEQCLNGRLEGGTRLALCAFAPPGTQSVPAAQIQLSNHVFQGISVVKDPKHLDEDIYFQAQMASLSLNSRDGGVALKPIAPGGPNVGSFNEAEQMTKRLLATVTWAELRAARQRCYAEWLRLKAPAMPDATV
jgi:hypothetical protein